MIWYKRAIKQRLSSAAVQVQQLKNVFQGTVSGISCLQLKMKSKKGKCCTLEQIGNLFSVQKPPSVFVCGCVSAQGMCNLLICEHTTDA